MTEKRKLKPDELLMESIHFDEDDLMANRAGNLGLHQVGRLKRLSVESRIKGWLSIVFGLVVFFPALVLTLSSFSSGIENSIPWLFLMASGMYMFMPIGIVALRAGNAQLLDSRMLTVERTEGRVSLDMQKVGGWIRPSSDVYTICLEGRDWTVTCEVFLAFKNGDPYALYYGPHSNVMLAAEWLREPPPGMDQPADSDEAEWADTQAKPKRGSMGQ